MRIMGLDFGDRTIGVAVSDAMGLTAQSRGVINRTNLTDDLSRLRDFIVEYQVEEIVVGYPLNMDGTSGKRTEKTLQFVNFIKKRLDIPVKVWDERLSTIQAEKILIEADLSRAKRKHVIDGLAAQIILQSFLDYQINKSHE